MTTSKKVGVERQAMRVVWRDGTLVGKRVICQRLRRQVVAVYDVEGGVRLDKPVDGLVRWNVDGLRIAT